MAIENKSYLSRGLTVECLEDDGVEQPEEEQQDHEDHVRGSEINGFCVDGHG